MATVHLPQIVEKRLRAWVPVRSRLLAAVSGGPDSVALAHILRSLPYEVVIGHVDHQLRKNSSQDAHFVETLARGWDVPYRQAEVSVSSHAASVGMGIEEAARDLRYKALNKMAKQARCRAIATAHTADDQGETVLMNMLRGAGPSGLAGIPPVREAAAGLLIVRPLLTITRPEVLTYLKDQRLSFRQDPSNRSLQFTRNRIRSETLPYLEARHPGLKKRLAQMGDIFREEEGFWEPRTLQEFNKTVRKNGKKITVDLTRLLGYHRALGRRILRHLLKGITFSEVERVFELAYSPNANLTLQLSGGLQVVRKGQELTILTSLKPL